MKWSKPCRKKRILLSITIVVTMLMTNTSVDAEENKVLYSWQPNDNKKIALTFDDGPHPVYTQEILDILAEYDLKATFFVVGENAEWFPDLVKKELEAGHEIGNHTYSHANLRQAQYDSVLNEILGMEKAVYENTEFRCKLLRPPGGMYGDNVYKAAENLDYTVILWSVDTRDWAHTASETIVQEVLSTVKSGDIILFHDYIAKDSPTPAALRKIIPELLAQDYQFVTVSELLGCG